MSGVVNLVLPEPNAALIASLKEALEQAERAEFVGVLMVKLRHDNTFAVHKIGNCSDLAMAGALVFAQHDLVMANQPK